MNFWMPVHTESCAIELWPRQVSTTTITKNPTTTTNMATDCLFAMAFDIGKTMDGMKREIEREKNEENCCNTFCKFTQDNSSKYCIKNEM